MINHTKPNIVHVAFIHMHKLFDKECEDSVNIYFKPIGSLPGDYQVISQENGQRKFPRYKFY